jgi:hypothetical protein
VRLAPWGATTRNITAEPLRLLRSIVKLDWLAGSVEDWALADNGVTDRLPIAKIINRLINERMLVTPMNLFC